MGFHFQNSVQDWPRAVARLPEGSLIKAIDRGDILRDAKLINPGVITALRHHGGPQNIFDGRGFEAYKELARQFFATFIDGTFRTQYARYTDLVIEWNEYLASSHTGAELNDRIDWAWAAAWVWANEYRTQPDYGHIRLALLSCPVGNDINRAFAEIALEYDCVLSYHAYDKFVGFKQRDPFSWRYHSGRWAYNEASWVNLKPDWIFGEAGPYAGVLEGWRHPSVLGGDINAYVNAVRTWTRELKTTDAFREGRLLGYALFTTGGTSEWQYYETRQPELDALAAMIDEEWTSPPPPPPPMPRQYAKKGHIVAQSIPRRQFDAVVDEAWERKESVFFSVDDAMQPAANSALVSVTSRTIDVWNVEQVIDVPDPEQVLEDFADTYYPNPPTAFNYRRIGDLFNALIWYSPVGSPSERASRIIWPGKWIDANPFLTRYWLGSSYSIHTGADLNLNDPTFDLDRNKPVYPASSGKVTYAGVPSYAWQGVVVIRHHIGGGTHVYTRYAHLQPDEILVAAEDWVKHDDIIGLTGRNMSGSSPGPYHLHFDVSITSVLLNDPGHWPGDNRTLVLQHYTDPKAWLQGH